MSLPSRATLTVVPRQTSILMRLEEAHTAATQAQVIAAELAGDLVAELCEIAIRCRLVAELDGLPVGQRDAIRRIGDRIAADATTIAAIRARAQ